MDVLDAVQQLKTKLAALKWGSTGDPVFGSVHITMGVAEKAAQAWRLPVALITPSGKTYDAELRTYFTETMDVTVVSAVAGDDEMGEAALIGGFKEPGNPATSGKGRGLLEIEEEVLGLLRLLQEDDGITVIGYAASDTATEFVQAVGFVVYRTYRVEMKLLVS